MSKSQYSCIFCIFQELMNRGKYAHMGLWVKYALRKSSCVSKIQPEKQKNLNKQNKLIMTVSVFLSTLQLIALLVKMFCPCLHCYTLTLTYFTRVTWLSFVAALLGAKCVITDGDARVLVRVCTSLFPFSWYVYVDLYSHKEALSPTATRECCAYI